MKKGISPVIAVVLLIAIAVTSVVSIYFWAPGMGAGHYQVPEPPEQVSAERVGCGDGFLAVQLVNHGTLWVSEDFTLVHGSGQATVSGVAIAPGRRAAVNFTGVNVSAGTVYTIVGSGRVTPALVVC